MREEWIMAPFSLSLSLPRGQGAGCLVVEKLSEGVLVLWLPRQRGLLWFGQNSSGSKMEMLVNESHLEHTDVEVGKESAPSPLTEFRERLVSRPTSRRWTMGFQAGPVFPEQRNWSRGGLKTFWKPAEPKRERAREGDRKPWANQVIPSSLRRCEVAKRRAAVPFPDCLLQERWPEVSVLWVNGGNGEKKIAFLWSS